MRFKIGVALTMLGLFVCVLARIATAAVVISPPTVDFGVQRGSVSGNGPLPPDWFTVIAGLEAGGTTDTRTVELMNSGPGPLTLFGVEAEGVSLFEQCSDPVGGTGVAICFVEPASFECGSAKIFYSELAFPVALPPGESCRFPVFHVAEGLGPLSASLRILTDAPTSPHIVPITALRHTYTFIADTVTTAEAALVQIEFPGCAMTAAEWLPRPGAAGSVSTVGLVPGAVLPYGVFRFEARPCAPSATRSVSIYFPAAVPPGAKYLAFGPTPTDAAPHWFEIPVLVSGHSVTFQVADNAPGDGDSAAGVILSHTALELVADPMLVPTLRLPMLLALAIAVLAIAAVRWNTFGRHG